MRAFRLGCEPSEKLGISKLAAQFIAPFVIGFVTWLLQRAQADGVRRPYFLSRDCQLVWKVAQQLAPHFGGIECRYLYISRQALFLPSANEISPVGMPWMRRSFEEPVLKNLLAKIELSFSDVAKTLGELAGSQKEYYRLCSEEDWNQFWAALNQEPVKTQINQLIERRSEAARQYFESEGVFNPIKWSLVDFGWFYWCY